MKILNNVDYKYLLDRANKYESIRLYLSANLIKEVSSQNYVNKDGTLEVRKPTKVKYRIIADPVYLYRLIGIDMPSVVWEVENAQDSGCV